MPATAYDEPHGLSGAEVPDLARLAREVLLLREELEAVRGENAALLALACALRSDLAALAERLRWWQRGPRALVGAVLCRIDGVLAPISRAAGQDRGPAPAPAATTGRTA